MTYGEHRYTMRWITCGEHIVYVATDGQPPAVIVVGDESAGKSTILEQLAMLPVFPRKAGVSGGYPGPARYCAPCHRMPSNPRNEGSQCVG